MREKEKIDPSKIIIVRRWSKLEWELHKKNTTQEKILDHYEKMGLKDKKWSSHLDQMNSFNKLEAFLNYPKVLEGEPLQKADLCGMQLVIILGGDGYFSYVSHYIDDQLVIGVKADPKKSSAVLYELDVDDFINFYPMLLQGNFTIANWTRLRAVINAKPIKELSLSDIFVGARLSVDMSRYVIYYKGVQEEQKTSGILVSTGTGSTGWWKKLNLTQQRRMGTFARTSRTARFVVRDEPSSRLSGYKIVSGKIKPDEVLKIRSLVDDGVVSPDSYSSLMYPFPAGDTVEISISDNPLRVITTLF